MQHEWDLAVSSNSTLFLFLIKVHMICTRHFELKKCLSSISCVPVSCLTHIANWHMSVSDIYTYNYIQSLQTLKFHFLKLLSVFMCQCLVRHSLHGYEWWKIELKEKKKNCDKIKVNLVFREIREREDEWWKRCSNDGEQQWTYK
jgi:hypothetical protein